MPSARRKSQEAVEHVLIARAGHALVGEQPLQLARTRAIEAEAAVRARSARRQQARAQRQLHVQQHVEAPAAQRARAALRSARQAGALIDGDKLDPGSSVISRASARPMIQVSRVVGQARCSVRTTGTT